MSIRFMAVLSAIALWAAPVPALPAGPMGAGAGGAGRATSDRAVDPHIHGPTAARIIRSEGFESGHPDLRNRRLGREAFAAGHFKEARTYFRRAGRYADKLSQAAYAELLWNGQGGATDRPLAYAWMDLAAERDTPALVVQRERYWHRLNTGERAQALRLGQQVYEEYADAVAKPRQARDMRRARSAVTGSRVGKVGELNVCLEGLQLDSSLTGAVQLGPGGCRGVSVTGAEYYADRYWEPEAYWAWQEGLMRTPSREERVDVGLPQALPAPPPED